MVAVLSLYSRSSILLLTSFTCQEHLGLPAAQRRGWPWLSRRHQICGPRGGPARNCELSLVNPCKQLFMEHFPGGRGHRQPVLLLLVIQQRLRSAGPIKSFVFSPHDQRTTKALSVRAGMASSKRWNVEKENCFKGGQRQDRCASYSLKMWR